ncbi:MAG TPA: DUF362 domain-containing protein [Terriglobales bacterium]|jgi:uncharacterized protein (DUF362 family)
MNIFISSLENGYNDCIERGFEFLENTGKIQPTDRIAIKPNLTFPTFRKGVMTNPEAVEALVRYIKNFTANITVCESDSGGYNRFSMDEVFAKTGLSDMAKRYGVRIVNMSYVASRPIHFRYGMRKFSVPLPSFLLDETDLFITMPVPKVHCNTKVSISLKNQWGVIQQPDLRLKLHPYFNEVIYQINKALPRAISVVDGRYGLTRNGPMRGDDLELNWFLIGDNMFYVDYAVSRLMGYDYRDIPHLRHAFRKERIENFNAVKFNTDCKQFVNREFYLKRDWTDYPGVFTFNSRLLAYIGYESWLAKPLHWLLYRFREPFY